MFPLENKRPCPFGALSSSLLTLVGYNHCERNAPRQQNVSRRFEFLHSCPSWYDRQLLYTELPCSLQGSLVGRQDVSRNETSNRHLWSTIAQRQEWS